MARRGAEAGTAGDSSAVDAGSGAGSAETQGPSVDAEAVVRGSLAEHVETVRALEPLAGRIAEAGRRLLSCLRGGGTVFWIGNGGSAADCQHLAAELVGRFSGERRALRSVALTTDTSVLTSVANDYGYEHLFARQLEAHCGPGDVLVAISTSGRSANVLRGVRTARELGAFTIGLTAGEGGELAGAADLGLAVPSSSTPRIQEAHLLIGHAWCDMVDRGFGGEREAARGEGRRDAGAGSR